jgi:glycosyltransferase involved in cell wall biosynthesis
MTPLRVVFVTRRFWPLLGGAEMAMSNLAAALHEAGYQVTLLTACWHPDWPQEIFHRGVRVVRLPQSQRRFWGTLGYMRRLRSWLLRHRSEFDLVYVSMLKHEAYVAVGTGRSGGFPVVLRAEGGGQTGDAAWHTKSRGGSWIRRRCQQASAVVAPSLAIQQELASAGFPQDRLHYIPNGVAAAPPRSFECRLQARAALGTAHPVLSLSPNTQLAIYVGRLSSEKGLFALIDAWSKVAARRANVRLWLVGAGPMRDELAQHIEQLHLRGRCVLVGSFDSVDDLLAAADLFVLPSYEEGMSLAMLEAMAAGLPIVASDIPGNRALIEDGRHGLLAKPGQPTELAAAIQKLLDDRDLANHYGTAARQRAEKHFSQQAMLEKHVALFNSLLTDKPST